METVGNEQRPTPYFRFMSKKLRLEGGLRIQIAPGARSVFAPGVSVEITDERGAWNAFSSPARVANGGRKLTQRGRSAAKARLLLARWCDEICAPTNRDGSIASLFFGSGARERASRRSGEGGKGSLGGALACLFGVAAAEHLPTLEVGDEGAKQASAEPALAVAPNLVVAVDVLARDTLDAAALLLPARDRHEIVLSGEAQDGDRKARSKLGPERPCAGSSVSGSSMARAISPNAAGRAGRARVVERGEVLGLLDRQARVPDRIDDEDSPKSAEALGREAFDRLLILNFEVFDMAIEERFSTFMGIGPKVHTSLGGCQSS